MFEEILNIKEQVKPYVDKRISEFKELGPDGKEGTEDDIDVWQ